MTPAKPSVLTRSYQQASFTARTIFDLSITTVWVHIVAIVYYKYLSATAPYYSLITNIGLLIALAWFLVSSYQLLGQIRCNCGVKTYKPEESYNDEFESTYLSYYARRICLLVTSLHVARFWWISVQWLGFPIIGVLNSPLLADLGFETPFVILQALFISVFNLIWAGIGLVALAAGVYLALLVVLGVVLEDFYNNVHRKMEREFNT